MANNDPKPKKEKKEKKDKSGKKSGGLLGKLISTVIFLAIAGLLVAVLGFNFMDIREKYMRETINKIPFLNTMLPAPPKSETEENADPRSKLSVEELIAQIDKLTADVTDRDTQIAELNKRIEMYTSEVTRLKEIEGQQEQFKAEKAEFDDTIAKGQPADYKKYYESIYPENADILYKEVVGITQKSKDLQKYVSTLQEMDEGAAAAMIEKLMRTDMNLVVMVLKNIDAAQSGAILGAMPADKAASVYKRLAPAQS